MLKNYFKIAFRSLWKNKFYTAINIGGLAVGLATGIMLLLWVQHEWSYDKFHHDYKDIYQVSSQFDANGEKQIWVDVPGPLSVYAKSIPQVENLVRIYEENGEVLSLKNKSKIIDGNKIGYVDTSFFRMFNFPFLKGNDKALFSNSHSIILTKSTAQKLFGNENAVGRDINFQKESFTVAGVLADFPGNSTLHFDAIFPMSFYANQFTAGGGNGDWKTIDTDVGNYAFTTYVKINDQADPKLVGQQFSSLFKDAQNGDSQASFELQNIGDIHLVKADGNNTAQRMVQIFMLVVILLLAIAGINYVNLSTARSLIRAKEVGIRKIIGARKSQLFLQFTIETVVLFCISTILAILLIHLLMPLYNDISGKKLHFTITDLNVWKTVGFAVVGTLILSSIYPAFLLSSFKPIESLKGKISTGIGITTFRKALVVFQFSISVILLVCTIIMSNQMSFLKNKDVGYNKDYVFSIPLPSEVVGHLDVIKTNLKNTPGILNVSASDAYDFTSVNGSTSDIEWKGKSAKERMVITQLSADKDFIPTMGITFLEGGNFTGTPADSSKYILNETAVKKMGLHTPYVGQEISFHETKGTIVGVVKDFNFQSLKNEISPLIFYTFWNNKNILYVRTTGQKAQQAIAAAEQQYKKYAADVPFTYSFLDKRFEEKYISDQRSGMLFKVFAGIAILISCLGLFGLATYTAEVKRKEIGIRKVLGSSISGIVQLMSKDFLKLVLISIIIAIPVGWWAMSKWLEGFAYRTDIKWWVFAIAGSMALFIALVTVSFQAIKAAIANPVESLRSE